MPEGPRCNLFHDFINKLPKVKKSRGRSLLVNTSFLPKADFMGWALTNNPGTEHKKHKTD